MVVHRLASAEESIPSSVYAYDGATCTYDGGLAHTFAS
jgi:hypothetical protein